MFSLRFPAAGFNGEPRPEATGNTIGCRIGCREALGLLRAPLQDPACKPMQIHHEPMHAQGSSASSPAPGSLLHSPC